MTAAGIVGTGSMGAAIAGRLLAAIGELRVYDLRPEATAPLKAAGAVVCPGPAALARECDAVLLSLPSHAEVNDVVFGPGGVLSALRPGGLIVNLTTGSVRALPRLAEVEHTHGVRYVTAPVSQAVDGAEEGRLTAYVSGTPGALQAARPLLACFCSEIIALASHEAAMTAKLVTNQLWAIHVTALLEALAMLVSAGVPPELLQQVVTSSCADSWVARHDLPHITDGTLDPSFTVGLAVKDLRLARELAGLLGVPLTAAAAAEQVFGRACQAYGPGAPELSPALLMAEAAGVQFGPVLPVPDTGGWAPDGAGRSPAAPSTALMT